jgi:predicted N-acetyltransferase YhbS
VDRAEGAAVNGILIRNELPSDFRRVEELTRLAFWNLHVPGCDEHYLVHTMRGHADFVPELDFVLLEDGRIVANIMYMKSTLLGANGESLGILTFGPVSVLPERQRKGLGSRLINYSMDRAAALGYPAIVIYGNPGNYVGLGFKSCKRFGVKDAAGEFPCGLLARELAPGALPRGDWIFRESGAYELEPSGFEEYDRTFSPLAKEARPRHEEYFILSNSRLR